MKSSTRSASLRRSSATNAISPGRRPPRKSRKRSPSRSSLVRRSPWRKRSFISSKSGSICEWSDWNAAPPKLLSMWARGPRSTRTTARQPCSRRMRPTCSCTSRNVGMITLAFSPIILPPANGAAEEAFLFLHRNGPRTRRVLAYLKRREKTSPAARGAMDRGALPRLSRRLAIVYTDTADFTVRTARDGILHFLMVFNRLVERAQPAVRRLGGELVKVEADSLLLRFPEADTACRGVDALERVLARLNRGRPRDERL